MLLGEAVRGPRVFKDKPLGAFTQGIESLLYKVLGLERCDEMARMLALQAQFGDDPAIDAMLREHDSVFIALLADSYFSNESEKLSKRAKLLIDTDNSIIYRARVSEWTDTFAKEDWKALRTLVAEILAPVEAAKVDLPESKKKEARPLTEQFPTESVPLSTSLP